MSTKEFTRKTKPFGILTEGQMEAIHQGALKVLENTGIQLESRRALEIMEKGGCRVDYELNRARIPAKLTVECLQQCPKTFTMRAAKPEHNIELGGDRIYFALFSGLRTVDPETWETRIPTVQDNHDACMVADGLEFVHASTSYTPYCEFVGVPPAMLLPISTWSRLKYFSKISRIGSAVGSHTFEVQMAQAAGVDVYGALEASPPLTFSEAATDCGILCAEVGFPVEPGCGGIMGGSHPVTLSGALVTGMAEVMAGTVLVQIVRPGNPIIVNSFDIPQNMRTGSPRFGSISISLFQVMWNQIWRTLYGIPVMNGGVGPSDSKCIDFQCGYEKATGILLSALSGANMINTVGGLTGELSYHPIQSVLDNELAGMILHFLQGVEVDDEMLAIDLIMETGPIPGFYLDKKHTRVWWKNEQFLPRAADDLPYTDWLKTGKRTAVDYAKECSEALLNKFQPFLPLEKEEALDRILADAEAYFRRKEMI